MGLKKISLIFNDLSVFDLMPYQLSTLVSWSGDSFLLVEQVSWDFVNNFLGQASGENESIRHDMLSLAIFVPGIGNSYTYQRNMELWIRFFPYNYQYMKLKWRIEEHLDKTFWVQMPNLNYLIFELNLSSVYFSAVLFFCISILLTERAL